MSSAPQSLPESLQKEPSEETTFDWENIPISPRLKRRMEKSAYFERQSGHWDFRKGDTSSELPTPADTSATEQPAPVEAIDIEAQTSVATPSTATVERTPSKRNLALEDEEDPVESSLSKGRRTWIVVSRLLTFYIPDCLLRCCMKSEEEIQSWREKCAIVTLILFMSLIFLAIYIVVPMFSCRQPHLYRWNEINKRGNKDAWFILNGYVLDAKPIMGAHSVSKLVMSRYLGRDVSSLFLRPPLSAVPSTCGYRNSQTTNAPTTSIATTVTATTTSATTTADTTAAPSTTVEVTTTAPATTVAKKRQSNSTVAANDTTTAASTTAVAANDTTTSVPTVTPVNTTDATTAVANTTEPPFVPDPTFAEAYEQYRLMSCLQNVTDDNYHCHPYYNATSSPYRKGKLAYTYGDLALLDIDQHWIVIHGHVYNTTDYINNKMNFLPKEFNSVIYERDRGDATDLYNYLFQNEKYLSCFDYVFYAGVIDYRSYVLCFTINTVLLSLFVVIAAVITIKTLTALLASFTAPHHRTKKYSIIQVPCYSENEDSMYKTLHSIATCDYSNSHKLIFVVCDGLITGKGNSMSTPDIVLKILGRKEEDCPGYYRYRSLKGVNRAKVYSGYYLEVPYIVVVKHGLETEKSKPGNRGKRDSQVLLLGMLNRLFYGKRMCELDIEVLRQIQNSFDVDPHEYEYLLEVDADTKVHKDWMGHLIYRMVTDRKIIGACGRTKVANKLSSWVTAIQVFEYWNSHVIGKAFESFFGSITCLPGCSCIYRLKLFPKKAGKGRVKPMILMDKLIKIYSNRNVESMHTRNLLSLGEDRFFTTLVLRFFPGLKTVYVSQAISHTIVPDSFMVLLSQRRRWIGSTISNLFELLRVPNLKGVGCFSIKIVIFLDLVSTFLLPVTLLYLGYLIFTIFYFGKAIPLFVLISLGITVGSPLIIIVFQREFLYIFWYLIYILAVPVWFFIFPLYAFMRLDEGSWGATRQTEATLHTKKLNEIKH